MDTYNLLKSELLNINDEVSSLLANVKSIPEMSNHVFDDWQQACKGIKDQIAEEIIHVAVVGTIKSGKSTFINALLNGDYLKRGAGVVTSIVTKIRSGKALRATLCFKSWDDVNLDMEQALVLFPDLNWRSENGRFDIRREKEREDLKNALASLSAEQLITNDTRDANSILLASYIKGYERVKKYVAPDSNKSVFDGDLFGEHKTFVSDDTLAVYLKDIKLEVKSFQLASNIEIADSQGSDSPNPLHLVMIQKYLFYAHLIIYVVSSRTGLRQADIKFLSMIKKMGIIDNIVFIINFDFSEHESIEDLLGVVNKVKEELFLIKPEPEIYTFSALFKLFKSENIVLSDKNRQRLAQWKQENEFAEFSDQGAMHFNISFEQKFTKQRYTLLLANHIERYKTIVSGIENWILINKDIITRDTKSADELVQKIKYNHERTNQIKKVIKDTFDGAVQKNKNEIKANIDRFFDTVSGELLNKLIEFIRNYQVDFKNYEKSLKKSGFSVSLYLLFQEFKQSLDNYIAQFVNPEIVRFVKDEEKKIIKYFDSVADPYELIVQNTLVEFLDAIENLGISRMQDQYQKKQFSDIDLIKKVIGIKIPSVVLTINYNARIKTGAFMRLGFYSIVMLFKKLFKKPFENKMEKEFRALRDSFIHIKKDTEKSICFHFMDFKENLKYQYFFKLIDGMANSIYDILFDRFQVYTSDFSKIFELIKDNKIDKNRVVSMLYSMEAFTIEINERINKLKEKLDYNI